MAGDLRKGGKFMNKLLTKIVGVALGLSLAVGTGVAVAANSNISRASAEEAVYYTLDGTKTGGTSGYGEESEITQDSITWSVLANTTMNPWRIGGKSLDGVDKPIYSTTPMDEAITKVTLSVGAASSVTVNSLDLIVASDAGFNSVLDTVSETFAASSTITFNPTTGTNWASGSYYKILFNITITNTSNKFIVFNNAKFYYNASAPVTYSVTYDGNTNTGGSVPTDNNTYSSGATVTVLGNTGNLTKTNYSFNGWNTQANGTGTSYAANGTFTISNNVTLYAMWRYDIRYTDDTNAKTITWDLTKDEYNSASASQVSWTSPKATMDVAKETATSDANNYLPPLQNTTRFYKNSVLTFAPITGYKIESIIATAATEGYATKFVESSWTNATAVASSTTVTITPSDKITSLSATISDTVGLSTVVVNYNTKSTLSSIAISGSLTNTQYKVGNNWDPTGLIVTATYADSSTSDVTSYVTWSFNPATATSTDVTSVVATASYTEGGVTKTAESTALTVSVTANTGSTDIITIDDTVTSGTSYSTTTGIAGETAVYTSHNAHATEANGNGLQYRSNDNTSGIVSTTSGGLIKSVTLTYPEGKTGQMDVYGKNTAYSGPSDLYSDSTKGTLLGSVSSTGTVTVSGDYAYVGVRSNNGARYLTSIEFEWAVEDPTAPKVTIEQSNSEQVAGNTGTLTAITQNAGSNVVTWSSSDTSVVSIDASTGAWQAKKIGVATITATLGSTGKSSTIVITVTGSVSVAEAIALIGELGGTTSEYKVTINGYVVSSANNSNNKSIYVADEKDGTTQLQIYFGYATVSNWSEISVKDTKISAKGNLMLFGSSTYEMTNPTDAQVISEDRAAVQDFVRDYMHMNDYDPAMDNSQGNDSCLGVSGYYMTAKGALANLSETQIALFQSDSEFDNAQARYEAWARAYGDSTPYAVTVGSARAINALSDNGALMMIIIISLVSVTAAGAYFYLRKKKEN